MNYQEYQNKQKKAPQSKEKPNKRPVRIWNFLSEVANPFQIIAVFSMFIFGFPGVLHLPGIPALFCFITCFLYLVRSKVKNHFEWLTLIWLFNATIWTCNYIFLT